MKLIKATGNGIVTHLDDVQYNIQETPIEISDEVAEKLHIQFGHLVEITNKPEEVVSHETPVIEQTQEDVEPPVVTE